MFFKTPKTKPQKPVLAKKRERIVNALLAAIDQAFRSTFQKGAHLINHSEIEKCKQSFDALQLTGDTELEALFFAIKSWFLQGILNWADNDPKATVFYYFCQALKAQNGLALINILPQHTTIQATHYSKANKNSLPPNFSKDCHTIVNNIEAALVTYHGLTILSSMNKLNYRVYGALAYVKPLSSRQYNAQNTDTKETGRSLLLSAIYEAVSALQKLFNSSDKPLRWIRLPCESDFCFSLPSLTEAETLLLNEKIAIDLETLFDAVLSYLKNSNESWSLGKKSPNDRFYSNHLPSLKHILVQQLLTVALRKPMIDNKIIIDTDTEPFQRLYAIDNSQEKFGCHLPGLLHYIENEFKRQYGLGKEALQEEPTRSVSSKNCYK